MRTDGFEATAGSFDAGLLSPVSAGRDSLAGDAAILRGLVEAEVAIVRALADEGFAPASVGDAAASLHDVEIDLPALALAGVAGGNPVIPLVKILRSGAPDEVRGWIHKGATSQDIVDTALMLVAKGALAQIRADLERTSAVLSSFADRTADTVAAGRTLTQHAVPTTIGLRAANWRRGVDRAIARLDELALPAQFGGAGGTMAALAEFVRAGLDAQRRRSGEGSAETGGSGVDGAENGVVVSEAVQRIRAAYAAALGLDHLPQPWHTTRFPITELGDTLAQAIGSVGHMATDVATASRTEIGELAEPTGGGSSAMPQKQNPARSVLIRSAAMRAPQLAATLHTAAGLFADERADGAWHAEWPALRELLRAALGAASHAADLAEGLRVNADAVARNLAATGGLIVSERISAVLGKERAGEIVAAVAAGGDLRALVADALAETGSDLAADDLLDPAAYTGIADVFRES